MRYEVEFLNSSTVPGWLSYIRQIIVSDEKGTCQDSVRLIMEVPKIYASEFEKNIEMQPGVVAYVCTPLEGK